MTENEYREQITPPTVGTEDRQSAQPRDYSDYQVVRQEYITSYDDILITFNRGRFYINSFGLSQFPDKDYIQVLVDEDTKSMVIKPSKKKKRDSFIWCGGVKKRKPRHIKCIPLFYLVFQMMQWDINARYQIRGYIDDYGEEPVIFVDLRDAICYIRAETNSETAGGNSPQNKPRYQMQMPQEWQKSFGMPLMEYENRQDIKTFDGMTVFDVEFAQNESHKARMKELSEADIGPMETNQERTEDQANEENEG